MSDPDPKALTDQLEDTADVIASAVSLGASSIADALDGLADAVKGLTRPAPNADLVSVFHDLLAALKGLARNAGDGRPCFCGMAVDNPMVKSHSPACLKARQAVAKAEGKHP